jgi:thiosulfate/3-mercaptopyruvate sulfurtransferase
MDRVNDVLRSGHGNLYDLRPPDYFRGEKKADIAKAAGHIPSACNLPADDFVNPDMTVKSLAEVEAKVEATGPIGEAPVITYCNSGRSASTGYFLFRLLGEPDISMYDGSMAEWTAGGKNPVETNEPAQTNR